MSRPIQLSTVTGRAWAGNHALYALAAVLLCGALAGASALGAKRATAALNLPRSTAAGANPIEPAVAAVPLRPRNVLLIVVDGLRADVADGLPALRALAARGARAELHADGPTFSSAQYVAMLCGVPPRDSGIRTNAGRRQTELDCLPDRVRAAGRRSGQVGDEVDWWRELFRFDEARLVPAASLLEEARPLVDVAFAVVHIGGVDLAGHAHGARSREYRAAAERADRQVAELAAIWDGTIAVIADHGHVLDGGHGGDEPEVVRTWLILAGGGVRAGARVSGARTIDVAPTLAALIGVAAPPSAMGNTLTTLLAIDDVTEIGLLSDDLHRQTEVDAVAATARAAWKKSERRAWMTRGVGLAIAVLALLLIAWRQGVPARNGALLGLAMLGGAAAEYTVLLGEVSFSAARTAQRVGLSAALFGGGAALLLLAPSFYQAVRGRLLTSRAWVLALGAVLGASPAAAAAFVHGGVDGPRFTCEPAWLAAGPLCAYSAFAATAAVLALLPLVTLARNWLSSAAFSSAAGR